MARLFSYLWFFLFALVTRLANANKSEEERLEEIRKSMGGLGYGTTRKEIATNRDRRKRQLRNLVNDMRKKLADHSAGERILKADEKATLEKRMDIYQRKMDSMQDDLDDETVDRIIEREKHMRERRRALSAGIREF